MPNTATAQEVMTTEMTQEMSAKALKNSLFAVISTICCSRQIFPASSFKSVDLSQGTMLQAFDLRGASNGGSEMKEIAQWLDTIVSPYIHREELLKLTFALLEPSQAAPACDAEQAKSLPQALLDGFDFE